MVRFYEREIFNDKEQNLLFWITCIFCSILALLLLMRPNNESYMLVIIIVLICIMCSLCFLVICEFCKRRKYREDYTSEYVPLVSSTRPVINKYNYRAPLEI